MRALLAKYPFEIVRDRGLPEIGEAMSAAIAEATKEHPRIVTASRV
jgi:hypothetical protein